MNYNYLLGFCIVLLIISGCTGGQGDQLTMKDLRIGREGVNIEFLDNKDIQVYEGDGFLINMMIRNQGAAATNLVYVLLGIENDYVKLTKKYVNGNNITDTAIEVTSLIDQVDFEGISPENPIGGFIEYEAELEAKKITLTKLQETLVSGILCYSYGTKFEKSVCIQPQNNLVGLQPACKINDIDVGSVGQGAPVAITKVEVSSNLVSGGNIRTIFKIYIENLGKGTVINDGAAGYICSASSKIEDPNKVWNYLNFVARLGNKEIKCRARKTSENLPFYQINLKNNKAEVICESISPMGVSYETPLLVEMFYDYTQTITKRLVIEKI